MKIFVTKEIEIIQGSQAAPLIENENELKNFEEGIGIKKIDKDRWLEAQYYERKTWCEQSRGMDTDRNEEHLYNFNLYKTLDSVLSDDLSVIELGCGPYTNLRYILPTITKKIAAVTLLDPLINDYLLNSPNCIYKNGILSGLDVSTINTPIEEFNISQAYDLVVMINVLDHCFDIDLIFERISAMLKDGGVFVFNERGYRDGLKKSVEDIYDAGHPIRISDEYLNSKLKTYKPLYSKEIITGNVINKYLILQK